MRVIILVAWAVVVIGFAYVHLRGVESASPNQIYDEFSPITIINSDKEDDVEIPPAFFDCFSKQQSYGTRWRSGKRSTPVQRWMRVPIGYGNMVAENILENRGQPETVYAEEPQHKEFVEVQLPDSVFTEFDLNCGNICD